MATNRAGNDETELGEPLHVFDLPQIYQKPSYNSLRDALKALSIQPESFEHNDQADDINEKALKQQILPNGVTSYLTSIIASQLNWVKSEDEREHLWDLASRCLSSRSGRTAMGDMTRSFTIRSPTGEMAIQLKEPALTGDNLGLKTWSSSFVLAQKLHQWGSYVRSNDVGGSSPIVLELGSGTGLLGLAAAASWQAHLILTDLPEIVPNLATNIELNKTLLSEHGGQATSSVLDWTDPESFKPPPGTIGTKDRVQTILIADPMYSPEHPKLLINTIQTWLRLEPPAYVFLAYPIRTAYTTEISLFHELMLDAGLVSFEEYEESTRDDWSDEVMCRCIAFHRISVHSVDEPSTP